MGIDEINLPRRQNSYDTTTTTTPCTTALTTSNATTTASAATTIKAVVIALRFKLELSANALGEDQLI